MNQGIGLLHARYSTLARVVAHRLSSWRMFLSHDTSVSRKLPQVYGRLLSNRDDKMAI